MEKFFVEKSPPLKGFVNIGGSKNSVLPVMASTLMSGETHILNGIPDLSDVSVMFSILSEFGVTIDWDKGNSHMKINSKNIFNKEAPFDLVTKMRASFLITGPLLSRFGHAKVPLPGGCQIGSRPVDLHLKGFLALGAKVSLEHGFVEVSASRLAGSEIYLDFPSVGATENIMMAAVLAEGETKIQNCAVEPEIVDLANFLNACGANIEGEGTDTITIHGVKYLHPSQHKIIPDRIEAGTFMIASAITKGDIILKNAISEHLKPVIAKLKEMNCLIEEAEGGLRVSCVGIQNCVDIKTMPYPGFPTDMQAPFMALLSVVKGSSVVTETVFENRFMHVSELKRMGAEIKIDSRSAVIEGVDSLTGAKVRATDLRAGAGLILAALVADGETEISDIHHIIRGYYNFEDKLKSLGAKIRME
ncbi:MAG: UDP-N-acetylglucosamine 1-carboxyvinyltransferase [Clostridiales bacterium]|nr:UDP-N-acetylglucosamine 1-carboxyvinyltransferase [Clostridiales bacterium]